MEQSPQTVEEFVTWVLDQDVSLNKVDPIVRQQLERNYVQKLENRIKRELLYSLSENELAHAEKLLDQDSMSEFQDYIGQRVPDADVLITSVLLRFRDEYLSA